MSDKEAELQKLQGLFQKLRDTDKADTEALAAAQRKFQAVSSGLLTDDGGGDSTLQDQLMGTYVYIFCLEPLVAQFEHYVYACIFLKRRFLLGNFTTHGQWEHQEQDGRMLSGGMHHRS